MTDHLDREVDVAVYPLFMIVWPKSCFVRCSFSELDSWNFVDTADLTCTILFNLYYKRRHYTVTRYLPLGDCAVVDGENESNGMTKDWLKNAYLQPALKECTESSNDEEKEQFTVEEGGRNDDTLNRQYDNGIGDENSGSEIEVGLHGSVEKWNAEED